DLGHVRIHADSEAARSAREVSALAYTVGSNIVFDSGQYAPGTPDGQKLLAHELVHVVQQQGAGGFQKKLRIDSPTSPAEYEADAVATRLLAGERVTVSQNAGAVARLQRQVACTAILNAPQAKIVGGIKAHNIITAQFVAQAGMGATRLAIPGAASTAFRTEGCGDTTTTVIEPQEIGPGKKSGEGRPDLAFRTGAVMEVAEIKVGTWTCLPFAEAQL